MTLCVNCGIGVNRCNAIRKCSLADPVILAIVEEWVAPRTVDESNFICEKCWKIIIDAKLDSKTPEPSMVAHQKVCILCGRSLLRRIRCRELKTNTVKNLKISKIISKWILPRTVNPSSVICQPCWIRASKACKKIQPSPDNTSTSIDNHKQDDQPEYIPQVNQNLPQIIPTIVLPDYSKPKETQSRCFIEGCKRKERNRIPLIMRKELLKMYKYYVPPNNRLCNFHIKCTPNDLYNVVTGSVNNYFTAQHIQDMFSLHDSEVKPPK